MRGAARAGGGAAGRLAAKHMIAKGQSWALPGVCLCGQSGMAPAMVMAGEWIVMARAGATKEPTINPRIASIARTRLVADHRSMTHNL